MKEEYTIKEEWSKRAWYKKPELKGYSLLEKHGREIAFRDNLEAVKKIRDNWIRFDSEPKYKVFKLKSGEYEVLKKLESPSWTNDNYNSIITQKFDENGIIIVTNRDFYDTLDEACEKLLEYEKIAAREIREPVDCI